MGRFDHLATKPHRGPGDMFRWKVVDALAGKNRKDPGDFETPRQEPNRELLLSGAAQLTWIGHASFLFTLGGKRMLIDPVFAPRVGPRTRVTPPGIAITDLPPIDAVFITHNHRDHLDEWTIRQLGSRPVYFAPLGHEATLKKYGATEVTELGWWQKSTWGALEIMLVPARHWSMRMPWDRNEMLWGGFVIRGPEGALYHSGDTAFYDGFAEIPKRAGAIDWALLPIGAYDPRWFMETQHMNPEEAVQAYTMLGARHLVAMHWGTFRLSDEPMGEPPDRARAAFRATGTDFESLWILDVGETRKL